MNPTESKAESVFDRLVAFPPVLKPHPTQAEAMTAWKQESDFIFEMMDEEELPRWQAFCSLVVTTPSGKVVRLRPGEELVGEWEGVGLVVGVWIGAPGMKVNTFRFDEQSERTKQLMAQAISTIKLEIQRKGKTKAN
jgi:hypothetical protein